MVAYKNLKELQFRCIFCTEFIGHFDCLNIIRMIFFFDMSALSSTAAILDTASKVLPLVVAVSGRVGSDTPLICQQSGMRGVIVEETVTTDFIHYLLS